jgi:uncharacterized membrane protein
MWTTIITWIMNPKNLIMMILGVCLILVTGYAGIKYVQVAAREKTIATQAADLKLKMAEIQTQKDQLAMMETNIMNIRAARESMRKVAAANKKLKAQIAQLSEVKDDGKEAQVYSGMFDFFTSGGVSDVPSTKAR